METSMQGITESSGRISRVIRVIDEIAFQTIPRPECVGMRQIALAIRQVEQLTQTAAASSDANVTASAELQRKSGELDEAIERLTLLMNG